MLLKNMMSNLASFKAENRLLKFSVAIIGIAVIVNTFMVFSALNYERVILVPPGLDRQVSLNGKTADEHYLGVFARYVSQMLFSYTPGTVKNQYEEVLLLYSPDDYPKAKANLYQLAESVVELKTSSFFTPQKISVDKKALQIEVIGARYQFIENRPIDNKMRTYLIDYAFLDGKFAVRGVSEKEDTKSPERASKEK